MKHHAYSYLIAHSLAILFLCSACHSSYRNLKNSETNTAIKATNNRQLTSTGSISSKVKSAKEEDSNWYRITYTFDTSKPVDPVTGLPPVAGLSVEGSQAKSKEDQETNNLIHTQEDISSTTTLSAETTKTEQTDTTHQMEVLSGFDKGIATGLSIGIPLFIITIPLLIYVRTRKKNSSK